MLFNIDHDRGETIMGWIMPDNPSVSPRVQVTVPGQPPRIVEAQHYRPLLKEQGLHNTGICGFVVDAQAVPDLPNLTHVDVHDVDTGLLVYRRRPKDGVIPARLARIETHLLRTRSLNEMLSPVFQMAYTGIETVPREALNALLGVSFTDSIYVTGRFRLRTIDSSLRDRKYKLAVMVRDPFEELSERLLLLKWATKPEGAAAPTVLGPSITGILPLMADADLSTVRGIADLARTLDAMGRDLLADPLTRQLTTLEPDEPTDRLAVGTALDALAECEVVGLREDVPGFIAMLGAVLDADIAIGTPEAPVYESVGRLTALLMDTDEARALVENDLEVYDRVKSAVTLATRETPGARTDAAA
jgi:hypothetical protein